MKDAEFDVEFVDIDTILIEHRSRDTDQAWVEALAAMIRETGMLHPVVLWRSDEGPRLVAGAHRIAAQKLNGETQIAATWSNATSLAQAKVLEITENIGRRELSALDRAQHLFDLKEAYEALHPEVKAGVAGAKARHGDATEIISFADDAAETLGLSQRSIQLAVALWKGLSPTSKSTIKGTWLADHQAGLMQLSKQTAGVQKKALALIFPPKARQPQATSVADALYILENGRLLNSVEKRFLGLNKTIQNLADEELDAVLASNEERIMAWVQRRIGGDK